MYLAVKDVKPLDDYFLLLKFENEEEKLFDVKPYLDVGKFKELKDKTLFKVPGTVYLIIHPYLWP